MNANTRQAIVVVLMVFSSVYIEAPEITPGKHHVRQGSLSETPDRFDVSGQYEIGAANADSVHSEKD